MKITRTSPLTGITRTKELPITIEQLTRWQTGTLIQEAMPHLTAGQREFLISGTDDSEWDEAFGPLEDL